jgi:glutaredoxin
MIKKVFFASIIMLMFFVVSCSDKGPGKYDSFAQCLTGNEVVMYGTDWCPHCKNQKALFGNSFQYVDYVNCDKDRNECVEAGVQGYPTWTIGGENYPGEQSLSRLSSLSGCKIVLDEVIK